MKAYQRTAFVLVMVAFLISVNISSVSFAADGQPFGPILGGLKSVYLQVEPLSPETEEKGIAAAQIRRTTERQLIKAGIKLLSEREYNNFRLTGSYPMARLDISINIDEIEVADTRLSVNFIVVKARQQAFLKRKPALRFFATTWQRQEINYSSDVADVHGALREIMDEFISAYNSANR
ncbi:MAG: hypothetical protein PVH99_10575 [Desulfobacteraceae bacterium]|jgi:hypothetical protein